MNKQDAERVAVAIDALIKAKIKMVARCGEVRGLSYEATQVELQRLAEALHTRDELTPEETGQLMDEVFGDEPTGG